MILLPSLWIYDCVLGSWAASVRDRRTAGAGFFHTTRWPFVCFSKMRCWWASNLVVSPAIIQFSTLLIRLTDFCGVSIDWMFGCIVLIATQSVVGRGNNKTHASLMYGQDRTACCRTWWISIVSYLATINLTVTLRPPCAHTDPQEPARSHNSTDAYPN
jgi:hypothetical protein